MPSVGVREGRRGQTAFINSGSCDDVTEEETVLEEEGLGGV